MSVTKALFEAQGQKQDRIQLGDEAGLTYVFLFYTNSFSLKLSVPDARCELTACLPEDFTVLPRYLEERGMTLRKSEGVAQEFPKANKRKFEEQKRGQSFGGRNGRKGEGKKESGGTEVVSLYTSHYPGGWCQPSLLRTQQYDWLSWSVRGIPIRGPAGFFNYFSSELPGRIGCCASQHYLIWSYWISFCNMLPMLLTSRVCVNIGPWLNHAPLQDRWNPD